MEIEGGFEEARLLTTLRGESLQRRWPQLSARGVSARTLTSGSLPSWRMALNIARKYWLQANCLADGTMRPCPVTPPTPGHRTAPRPPSHWRGTVPLRVAPATSKGTVSTPSHLQPLATEPRPDHSVTGAGPTTCALHLQRPRVRSRPGHNSNPWPRNRAQTIPSPARDRPLARCTCNVQRYGLDPVAAPTPGHGTAPRPSCHRRGTDPLRVAPATSKGTVSTRSQLQSLVMEPRPDHPVTGLQPLGDGSHARAATPSAKESSQAWAAICQARVLAGNAEAWPTHTA
jgi:hypothetical protein